MNIPDNIDYSSRENELKTQRDLNELRNLYKIRKDFQLDLKSDFEKKVLSLKAKLFSKPEIEEERFKKIISFLE